MKFEEISLVSIKELLLNQKDDYGEIYLIGGYVRDTLINKPSKDLDFAVVNNSVKAARAIADKFNGVFYLLDQTRGTARALITIENQQMIVDVAKINGENIIEDLNKRDFSINAMAIDLANLEFIIDPLDGQLDLQMCQLKPCSESSFTDDPIRTLRAIRFIESLSLNYDQHIKDAIINASINLFNVSGERIREELCQIFNLSEANEALQLMIEFGLFKILFPNLFQLKDIPPRAPHVNDAFTHSMRVVELINLFLEYIYNKPKKNKNKYIGDVFLLIGKYENDLRKYLDELDNKYLSINALLVLAALFHDSGKAFVIPIKETGKTMFPDHAEISASMTQERMKTLAFSNEEIDFVKSIIRYHMSEKLKYISEEENPNRNIYLFFQETGITGVMIGFLHLADVIATYEETLTQSRWKIAMKSVNEILDGWFNHFADVISPPKLLNGNDLMEKFGLQAGRELGHILEQICEEQAAGTILTKNDALDFAEKMINNK